MWVSYVNGTPKMSQIGPLIYGITQMSQRVVSALHPQHSSETLEVSILSFRF